MMLTERGAKVAEAAAAEAGTVAAGTGARRCATTVRARRSRCTGEADVVGAVHTAMLTVGGPLKGKSDKQKSLLRLVPLRVAWFSIFVLGFFAVQIEPCTEFLSERMNLSPFTKDSRDQGLTQSDSNGFFGCRQGPTMIQQSHKQQATNQIQSPHASLTQQISAAAVRTRSPRLTRG